MPLRRSTGFILATALLCASARPAYADDVMDSHFDSPIGPADGRVPTAKKIVTVALLTGTVVSFATSFVFLAQANGAEGDRKELLQGAGTSTETSNAQCRTAEQCGRLSGLRDDRDDARSRWETAMIVGSTFAVATLATLILWPNVERDKPRVSPQATPGGGGLTLQGSF